MNNQQLIESMKPHLFSRFNNRDQKGSVVLYMKPLIEINKCCNDTNKETIMSHVSQVVNSAIQLTVEQEPGNTNPTIVTFMDLKGVLMSDLTKRTKAFVVMMIQYLQETYVDIMTRTYIYNPPVFIKIAYKFFYRFIDPDTREKINIVQKNKEIISADEMYKN